MDRTKASDAFNAGSIPVGCIYITLALIMSLCREPHAALSLTKEVLRNNVCVLVQIADGYEAAMKRKVSICERII